MFIIIIHFAKFCKHLFTKHFFITNVILRNEMTSRQGENRETYMVFKVKLTSLLRVGDDE